MDVHVWLLADDHCLADLADHLGVVWPLERARDGDHRPTDRRLPSLNLALRPRFLTAQRALVTAYLSDQVVVRDDADVHHLEVTTSTGVRPLNPFRLCRASHLDGEAAGTIGIPLVGGGRPVWLDIPELTHIKPLPADVLPLTSELLDATNDVRLVLTEMFDALETLTAAVLPGHGPSSRS